MKRLFIAVDIHPGDRLKEALELVHNTLRTERINWVNPEQLHSPSAFKTLQIVPLTVRS
jgi:2'-5' RNA ligase